MALPIRNNSLLLLIIQQHFFRFLLFQFAFKRRLNDQFRLCLDYLALRWLSMAQLLKEEGEEKVYF